MDPNQKYERFLINYTGGIIIIGALTVLYAYSLVAYELYNKRFNNEKKIASTQKIEKICRLDELSEF